MELISTLTYNTHQTNTDIQFHVKYKVIFVTKGTAELTLNNNIYTISENDMLFLSNCDYFSIRTTGQAFHRYIMILSPSVFLKYFDDEHLLSLFKLQPYSSDPFIHIKNSEDMVRIFTKLEEEMDNCDNTYHNDMIKIYLHQMMIMAYRLSDFSEAKNYDEVQLKILKAQNILESRFKEAVKISDLCIELNMSLYYFTHQFTKFVGCSPKQYLIKIRLNVAGKMLISTSLTIYEIAENSGFPNVNLFITCFKKNFGITPTEFRKRSHKQFQMSEG